MTRTYTRYFGPDELEPLEAALVLLRADYKRRIESNRYVEQDTKNEARERLEALELAARRLGDRVPE